VVLATIETSQKVKMTADVIFVDHRSDIAFITVAAKMAEPKVEKVTLACRRARLGEQVSIRGNPSGHLFISAWGFIAGEPRPLYDWAEVIPVNIMSAPGYSGGPLFDAKGEVLGVHVGSALSHRNTLDFGMSVPSLSVCKARNYLGIS
jgi:S1-C subfamily serine protease